MAPRTDMNAAGRTFAFFVWLGACASVEAHPVPFSYVDLRVDAVAIEAVVVVHTFDAAHDLNVQPPERLLDASTLEAQGRAIIQLLNARLTLTADGSVLRDAW